MSKNYTLVAAFVKPSDNLYSYITGVLVDDKKNIVQITELCADPNAFEIIKNGKKISQAWYPEQKISHLTLAQRFLWVAEKMC